MCFILVINKLTMLEQKLSTEESVLKEKQPVPELERKQTFGGDSRDKLINKEKRSDVDKEFDDLRDMMPENSSKESKGLQLVFKKSQWESWEKVVEMKYMEKNWEEALFPFELKIKKINGETWKYEVEYHDFDGSGEKNINGKTYGDLDGNYFPLFAEDVSTYIKKFYEKIFDVELEKV